MTNGATRFGRLLRLIAKEQKEILRDRRTLITLVVMPILLYPLVGLVIQQFVTATSKPPAPVYWVGFQGAADAHLVGQLVQLADAGAPTPPEGAPELSFHVVAKPDELMQRLRNGEFDVAAIVRGAVSLQPGKNIAVDVELVAVRHRRLSEEAAKYLRDKLDSTSKQILAKRLDELKAPQRPEPIRIEPRFVDSTQKGEGFPLASVAPFMLILMTITGAVYPAIDLTAGERERGTLEILMAAPVPRLSILVAKYVAVLTVALLTALVNITAMAATLYLTNVGRLIVGAGGMSAQTIGQGLAALVLFVGFFSALLLALASFARSFKEAQAYLIPLMLVALAPGVVSLFPGVELTPATAAAPLLNIVLFSRDLLREGVDGRLTAIVLATNACYAAAALMLAARLFGSEGVLYGGAGSWSGIVRRPDAPRGFVPISAAVFLVGITIPSFLLLHGAARLALPDNLIGQLLAGAVVLPVVFVLGPLLVAWNRNIPMTAALSLRSPGALAPIAALLLGASLWPFAIAVHEHAKAALVDRKATSQQLKENPQYAERIKQFAEELRRTPLSAQIVLLAVVPALCEEIFFRGFLFGALVRLGAFNAILSTTLLFAFFHVLSPAGLTPDRFTPSLLLGLFLGLLRWRSQSVWPGMLMHAAHNTIVAVGLQYPKVLGLEAHADGGLAIPTMVVVVAAGVALSGVGLLLFSRRRAPE